MKLLRTLFAALGFASTAGAAQPAPVKDPAEMMRQMRMAWLTRVPEPGSYKDDDEIVAILMDWPLNDEIVTVLASNAGDASLYTTSTFGIIGGIGHEKVRAAAKTFVETGQRHVQRGKVTTDFPYPAGEVLLFYFVTSKGVRSLSFAMNEVEVPNSPARSLYAAAQAVVTELRQITPAVR